jgi:hypothetical protein
MAAFERVQSLRESERLRWKASPYRVRKQACSGAMKRGGGNAEPWSEGAGRPADPNAALRPKLAGGERGCRLGHLDFDGNGVAVYRKGQEPARVSEPEGRLRTAEVGM